MQSFMDRVIALEEQLQTNGSFVFGGALRDSDAASVVYAGDVLVTDGPFAESKEQIAGFYIINAEDDDEARAWARRGGRGNQSPDRGSPVRRDRPGQGHGDVGHPQPSHRIDG